MAEQKNTGSLVQSTIDTVRPSDTYATHRSRKGEGGPFSVRNLEGLQQIPFDRLYHDCYCTVQENSEASIPRTMYVLKKLPIEYLPDPGVDVYDKPGPDEWSNYRIIDISLDESHEGFFLNFWKIAWQDDTFDLAYDEEFAPDYDGSYYTDNDLPESSVPPFPYDKDAAWNAANWSQAYDPSIHEWKRVRWGNSAPSLPFRVTSDYEVGDIPNFLFRWYLTQQGKPPKPKFMAPDNINPNSQPPDWVDTPPEKPDGDYQLWELRGILNYAGVLKRPWQEPVQVPINGDLVRYSVNNSPDPSGIVDTLTAATTSSPGDSALLNAGWFATPHPKYSYRATRRKIDQAEYSTWNIERIGQETSERTIFIYRNFPEKLANYILNNPDEEFEISEGGDGQPFRPQVDRPEKWTDKPDPNPMAGWIPFEIQANFSAGGRRITPWSDPIPKTASDLVIGSITSDRGNSFRFRPNQEPTREFTQITLTANLVRGKLLLNGVEDIAYDWRRINNGGSAQDTVFGTDRTVVITPDDVNGSAIFECQMRHTVKGIINFFTERYEILDIADGADAKELTIKTNTAIFFTKEGNTTPSTVTLEGFAKNILHGTLAFTWSYRNGQDSIADGPWTDLIDQTAKVTLPSTEFLDQLGATDFVEYRCRVLETNTNAIYEDRLTVSHQDLEDGILSYSVVLSNPQHTIPTREDGTLINNLVLDSAFTSYQIFEEGTDVTSDYDSVTTNIQKTLAAGADNSNDQVAISVDTNTKRILVTSWGAKVQEANVQITFEDIGNVDRYPLQRNFKLIRQTGYGSIIVADIDVADDSPSNGFVFFPGDTADKDLTVVVYSNGLEVDDLTGWTIDWDAEGSTGSGETFTVTPEMVDSKLTVKVTVTNPEGSQVARKAFITELADAEGMVFLHHPGIAKPDTPTLPYEEYIFVEEDLRVTGIHQANEPIWLYKFDVNYNYTFNFVKGGGAGWDIIAKRLDGSIDEIQTNLTFPNGATGTLVNHELYSQIGLRPRSTTNQDTHIALILKFSGSDSSVTWTHKIVSDGPDATYWRSEKRRSDPPSAWSEPFRFAFEEAQFVPGGFMATFMAIRTNEQKAPKAPRATVQPEVEGTSRLKDFFTSDGVKWYSEGNLPSFNRFTHKLYQSQKLVRFTREDNYISSTATAWTAPRLVGGTNGLNGSAPLFIFRRQSTRPSEGQLPVNNLKMEQSGGTGWSVQAPSGNAQLWMSTARFEWNTMLDRYVQQENWSRPEAFGGEGSRIAYLYQAATQNDRQPASPTASPEDVLSAGGTYRDGAWRKTSTNAHWKAIAYYNGAWSVWFIERLTGATGAAGANGSKWYLFNAMSVSSESSDKHSFFVSTDGRVDDYAIKPDGRFYQKTNAQNNRWYYRGRGGNRIYSTNELSGVSFQGTGQFRSTSGAANDLAIHEDGNIYKRASSSTTWTKVGALDLTQLFSDQFWVDRWKVKGTGSNFTSWDVEFQRSVTGIVYVSGNVYRGSGGQSFRQFTIPSSVLSWLLPMHYQFSAGVNKFKKFQLGGVFIRESDDGIGRDTSGAFIYKNGSSYHLTLEFAGGHTAQINDQYPSIANTIWNNA